MFKAGDDVITVANVPHELEEFPSTQIQKGTWGTVQYVEDSQSDPASQLIYVDFGGLELLCEPDEIEIREDEGI